MSVKYVLVARPNPMKRDAPKKYYAQSKSAGDVNLKQISRDISLRCTVNSADILAVIDALIQQLMKELEQGCIVRMGDFGDFQVYIAGEGSETEEQFNSSLIKKSKIIFRPGKDMKDMLTTLSFSKV